MNDSRTRLIYRSGGRTRVKLSRVKGRAGSGAWKVGANSCQLKQRDGIRGSLLWGALREWGLGGSACPMEASVTAGFSTSSRAGSWGKEPQVKKKAAAFLPGTSELWNLSAHWPIPRGGAVILPHLILQFLLSPSQQPCRLWKASYKDASIFLFEILFMLFSLLERHWATVKGPSHTHFQKCWDQSRIITVERWKMGGRQITSERYFRWA